MDLWLARVVLGSPLLSLSFFKESDVFSLFQESWKVVSLKDLSQGPHSIAYYIESSCMPRLFLFLKTWKDFIITAA